MTRLLALVLLSLLSCASAQDRPPFVAKVADAPFRLSLEPGRRDLVGRVRTQSGAPLSSIRLAISMQDAPELRWEVSFVDALWLCARGSGHWAELVEGSDPEVARFEIFNIPPGELVLEAEDPMVKCFFQLEERADGSLEVEVLVLDGERTPD